jgi:hypothetical protein
MRPLRSENNRDEESQLRKKENGNLRKEVFTKIVVIEDKTKGFWQILSYL